MSSHIRFYPDLWCYVWTETDIGDKDGHSSSNPENRVDGGRFHPKRDNLGHAGQVGAFPGMSQHKGR